MTFQSERGLGNGYVYMAHLEILQNQFIFKTHIPIMYIFTP